MALVEPPVPPHRQPAPARRLQGQIGGPDGPGQERGVEDPQVQGSLRQQAAGLARLGLAELGQVHVVPSGEEVLGVPLRLAVAEEYQLRHGASVSRRPVGQPPP